MGIIALFALISNSQRYRTKHSSSSYVGLSVAHKANLAVLAGYNGDSLTTTRVSTM